MKYKAEILFTAIFILFIFSMFLVNPDNYSFYILFILFIYCPGIILIEVLKSEKFQNVNLVKSFKSRHIIIQGLMVLMVFSLIYDIITRSNIFYIIFLIFWIAIIIEWFLKKEK